MAILIGGLVPWVSRSADYWVGPGGRDREGSGGQRKPWATLQFAADHVKPGDTVHLLDGDYTGFFLSRSGEVRAPIRFIAERRSVRNTRRNRETPDGINIEGAGHIVVDGFVIDEMPRAGGPYHPQRWEHDPAHQGGSQSALGDLHELQR